MEVKRRTARSLVQRLSSVSEQTQTEAICELRLISKHDPDSRSFIAEAGAIPYLTETLYSSSTVAQENALATLLNISISNRDVLMSTRGLLDALSHVLRLSTSTPATVQTAAATLYSLLVVDEYRPIIGAKRDIIFALVDIIRNSNSPARSIKDALKALFGISLYPLNRATMVELGAVPALFSLVVKDGRIGVVEDATAVIAQVAGCFESGDAFRKLSGVGILVDLLDPTTGSTVRVRENAVSALLNLVQCGGEKVVEDIREMGTGVLDGIAEVAKDGSAKAKGKASMLFNVLDRGGFNGVRDPRFGFVLEQAA
ncbi:PREDICTED: U-box domain-containing protein 11 [Nelumbo nucifera]|uniref:U-box domain-containing protein 11 n=1 Tax=Nelumbo nucifera TaxID=4432 RepID=A0A1U8BAD3_NELNU|nr:PREDICTED: U-box domain-containing protein 11 [Nelumbo nucifera]